MKEKRVELYTLVLLGVMMDILIDGISTNICAGNIGLATFYTLLTLAYGMIIRSSVNKILKSFK